MQGVRGVGHEHIARAIDAARTCACHAWDALQHEASMCSPSKSLLSNHIGAVSCSFPISQFRTQHLTQYYILHRDCILYLYVKIYMIQSNEACNMRQASGEAKWGKPGEGPVQKYRINDKHRMCSTPTSSLSWSVRSSNSSQGSSPPS